MELGCKKCYFYHQPNRKGICSKKGSPEACNCVVEFKTKVYDEFCPFEIWYEDVVDEDRLNEVNEMFNFEL